MTKINQYTIALDTLRFFEERKNFNFRIDYLQFLFVLFINYLLPSGLIAMVIFIGEYNAKTIYYLIFFFLYILFTDLGFKDYFKTYTHFTIDCENREIRLSNVFTKKSKVVKMDEIKSITFEVTMKKHREAHLLTMFLEKGEIVQLNLYIYKVMYKISDAYLIGIRLDYMYLPWFKCIEKEKIFGYENVFKFYIEYFNKSSKKSVLIILWYIANKLGIDLKEYLIKEGYFKKKMKKYYETKFVNLEKQLKAIVLKQEQEN